MIAEYITPPIIPLVNRFELFVPLVYQHKNAMKLKQHLGSLYYNGSQIIEHATITVLA